MDCGTVETNWLGSCSNVSLLKNGKKSFFSELNVGRTKDTNIMTSFFLPNHVGQKQKTECMLETILH